MKRKTTIYDIAREAGSAAEIPQNILLKIQSK